MHLSHLDYLAARAMAGILANPAQNYHASPEEIALRAYAVARAMVRVGHEAHAANDRRENPAPLRRA